MIRGDKKGFLYSQFIVPKLFELKEIGVDLKPFFNSVLPYHKVDENNLNFITYLSDS